MKIGVVLGTRPEIIKLSPVIRRCSSERLGSFIVHTNQHYSDQMDAIFFKEMELPNPAYNLRIGSGPHGEMFCPTRAQARILLGEGIDARKILVTGNTIVDAVFECSGIAERKARILSNLGLAPGEFILMTSHRPATVDAEARFRAVLRGVERIAAERGKTVVFPIQPRARRRMEEFGLEAPKRFRLIEPVGYLDMLQLQRNAFLVVTDSGGIQEETCILRKRCLVIRENTERPEALEVGGGELVGNSDPGRIAQGARRLLARKIRWRNPFGDGNSAARIVKALRNMRAARRGGPVVGA